MYFIYKIFQEPTKASQVWKQNCLKYEVYMEWFKSFKNLLIFVGKVTLTKFDIFKFIVVAT